ncbi:hypothetical protein Leryth_020868 [Lithospermum erythrorhizon]|nr:hypothetical protein Leryth_020868 [Lithospermum erythrorhizon]
MATPTKVEVLHLFRSFLNVARGFPDYNIREYIKRRSIDAFRQNKNLRDMSEVVELFKEGKTQLELAKRQSIVYSLYAPKVKSIMEIKN